MFQGRKFKIYGAFKSEKKARQIRQKHNAFVLVRNIKGHKRFVVMKEK